MGHASQEIELANGSSFGDLSEVDRAALGNAIASVSCGMLNRRQFRGAVFLVMNKHVVQDLDTPLADGSEVTPVEGDSGRAELLQLAGQRFPATTGQESQDEHYDRSKGMPANSCAWT